MRYRSVSAFESSSSSSEFAKRYERQILKLAGFVERYFQIKWIFPSIMAQTKSLIFLDTNSHAKMAPDTLDATGPETNDRGHLAAHRPPRRRDRPKRVRKLFRKRRIRFRQIVNRSSGDKERLGSISKHGNRQNASDGFVTLSNDRRE